MIFLQFQDIDRGANARHYILALRVQQKLAVELLVANRRIAGETDARGTGVAEIAEDHRLHVHRRAQIVRDVVNAAIVLGAIVLPGTEYCVARHDQLLVRILRKVALGVFLHDLLVFRDHFFQRFGIEVGIELRLFLLLLGVEDFVERRFRNLQHHVAEHLNQTAVGIVGKARVIAALRERFDALIVQAEIENRIHHARHGKLRARADAYQQRILALAEFLTLQLLEMGQRLFHFAVNLFRNTSVTHVFAAGFRLNREARRHGQAGIGHFGQAGAFSAEFVFHLAVAIGFAAAEEVDVLDGWLLAGYHYFCFGESLCRHK